MANGFQVVFDCSDPNAMAAFWSEALGYIVQPPPPGFDSWPEAERLAALGAVELYERHETAGHWITMQDPEGNEFCLQ